MHAQRASSPAISLLRVGAFAPVGGRQLYLTALSATDNGNGFVTMLLPAAPWLLSNPIGSLRFAAMRGFPCSIALLASVNLRARWRLPPAAGSRKRIL